MLGEGEFVLGRAFVLKGEIGGGWICASGGGVGFTTYRPLNSALQTTFEVFFTPSAVTCVKLRVFLHCTKMWCFLQRCRVLFLMAPHASSNCMYVCVH